MSCYFFLSYARASDRGCAKRFFDDLSQAIRDKKGLGPSEAVGFFDERNIELGKDWQREIITALQKCRTMVCLYAPAYFKSSYCGKEWEIFDRRRRLFIKEKLGEGNVNATEDKPGEGEKDSIESERGAEGEGQTPPPAIKPVVWIPTKEQDIPAAVSGIQYTSGRPGDTYNKQGLQFMLMHYNSYQLEYDLFVDQLAENILDTIERYNLLELPKDEVPLLSDVPNPFFPEERPSRRRTIVSFARATHPFFEQKGERKNKRAVAALILVALLSVVIAALSILDENTKPVLDVGTAADKLDVDISQWIPTDIGWNVRTDTEIFGREIFEWKTSGRRITGDRLGLFRTKETKNSFNIYQDFTLDLDLRFINGKGVAWVVRAKDFSNYYLFELCTTKSEKKEKKLYFYVCKDGELDLKDSFQVPVDIEQDFASINISVEVIGNNFKGKIKANSDALPEYHVIYDFKNDTFKYGGVGFLPMGGMDVLLQQLLIQPK